MIFKEFNIPPHPLQRSDGVHHTLEFYGYHITKGDESLVDDDEPTNH